MVSQLSMNRLHGGIFRQKTVNKWSSLVSDSEKASSCLLLNAMA